MQLESLGNAGHDQACLQQGKGVAEALARADAEGDISVPVSTSRPFGGEALGVEEVGGLPEGRVAVKGIDADSDYGAGGDVIAADSVVGNGALGFQDFIQHGDCPADMSGGDRGAAQSLGDRTNFASGHALYVHLGQRQHQCLFTAQSLLQSLWVEATFPNLGTSDKTSGIE